VTIASRAYARTQTQTATKERLMSLLFEAALKHMRTGRAALAAKRAAEANQALGRAAEIVTELTATLDHDQAPELCGQLTAIYLFVSERLTKALLDRDPNAAHEAERAFAPIADGFVEAVKVVERGAAAAPNP
jgi:flagellar secretion chaperone FliS